MTIYDIKNQDLFHLNQLISGTVFLFFGVYCYFFPGKLKVEENFATRFLGLTKIDLLKRATEAPKQIKMIGIIAFLFSIIIFFLQFQNMLYIYNIQRFEKIETLSSRIDSIHNFSMFKANCITFFINDKEFSIMQDNRYVALRNLLINDSVMVDYFEAENNLEKKLEVVKIELK